MAASPRSGIIASVKGMLPWLTVFQKHGGAELVQSSAVQVSPP